LERNKTIHDMMMEKVQTYVITIKRGSYKLVTIRLEDRLREITGFYNNGDVGYIPERKIEELIGIFQNCQDINFWHSDLPLEIEKTIQNLQNNL